LDGRASGHRRPTAGNAGQAVAALDQRWRDAESTQDFQRPRGFTSVDDLLSSAIDTVPIATPDRTHFHMAKRPLDAGKHVLIEKQYAQLGRRTQPTSIVRG
jgi:predicted dehydrogenase